MYIFRRSIPKNQHNLSLAWRGKIEKEFENILACLSGAQMGSNHEKSKGQKSRELLLLTFYYVVLLLSAIYKAHS